MTSISNTASSLFRSQGGASGIERRQSAIRRTVAEFEGLLWNEVAQSMSSVSLGPSDLGNAGKTYQRMMWQQITSRDFTAADRRLTDATLAQFGIKTPDEGVAPSLAKAATRRASSISTAPALDTAARIGARSTSDMASASVSRSSPVSASVSASSSSASHDVIEWAKKVWGSIQQAARTLGVPAKGLLAQAALETGWGHSAPGNNLFGVKAHGAGPSLTSATHEFVNGAMQKVQAAFQQYPSVRHGIEDFMQVLRQQHSAAIGQSSVAAYASALQSSGYATDPGYAAKIEAIAGSPIMQSVLDQVKT